MPTARPFVLALAAVLLAGCSTAPDAAGDPPSVGAAATAPSDPARSAAVQPAPPPPAAPDGPLAAEVLEALEHRFWLVGRPRPGDVAVLAASGDVRVAWPLVDLLRFEEGSPLGDEVDAAIRALTGAAPPAGEAAWRWHHDHLLRHDVPAPPDHVRFKHAQYRLFDPNMDPFFEAAIATVDGVPALDWREVAWGGVAVGGIPELVDPAVVTAAEADWLDADDRVFGVVVDGEARAYPARVLEVHELANDRLGGVPIALAHCTLCGVATAWRRDLDGADQPLHLATSGLLRRSNKLMFDRETGSLFDQFDGIARTGPLGGLALVPVPVTTTTWTAWRSAHPATTVVDRPPPDLDRYDGSFLGDRPDAPLFPVGATDDRLAPHVEVVGVRTTDGVAVAFERERLLAALVGGRPVVAGGLAASLDEDGVLVVRDRYGGPALHTTTAFWFAWSQFRPDTLLWP